MEPDIADTTTGTPSRPEHDAAAAVPTLRVDRDSTAREVIRAAIARSVRTFLTELTGTIDGVDPEPLHQARVSVRRLRSDLRTFGPLLDPTWTAPLRTELRWIGGSLGSVRDLDVLDLTLVEITNGVRTVRTSEVDALRTEFAHERDDARATLLDDLASPRCDDLITAMIDAATDPRTAPQADDPAATMLPELVRAPWEKIRRAVGRLGPDPEDAALHRIRILAKRNRYAAEAVAAAIGRPAKRYARSMAQVQECLGDLNDAVVITAHLRHAADHDHRLAFVSGQLAMVLARRAEHCRGDFPAVWDTASDPGRRAWF